MKRPFLIFCLCVVASGYLYSKYFAPYRGMACAQSSPTGMSFVRINP